MKKILMALALMPLMALAIDVKVTGTGMKHLIGWGYYIEYTIDGVAYRSDTAPQAMNLIAWRNMSEEDQKKTIDAYGWQSGRRMEDFGYAGAQEIADKINEKSGWTALWDKFKENLINRDYPTLAAIFDKDDTRSAYFEENYTPHWQSGVEFVWNDEMLQLLEEQHLVWQWSYESYLAVKNANEKRLQTGVQALSGDLIALIVDKVLVPRITMGNPIELGFKYGIRKEVLGAILDYANSITGAGDALLEQVLTERVTCESGAEIVAKLTDMVNMNLHMMNLCKKRLIENRSAMESLGVQNAVANEKAKKELDAKVAAEKNENEERLVEMTASDEPDAATLAVNSSLSAEIGNLQARLARDTDDEEELERQIAQKMAEWSAYNQGMHSELVVQYEAWVNRYNDAVKEWLEKRPAVKRISSSYAEAIACGYTFTLGPEVDPTVEPEINAYIASLREYINDYPLWRAEGLKLYGQFQDELEPIVMKHAALEGVGALTASVGVGDYELRSAIKGSASLVEQREQALIDRAEANLRAYKFIYQQREENLKEAAAKRAEKRANAELAVIAYLDAKKGKEDCLLNLPAYLDGLEVDPLIFNVPKTSKLWQDIFGGKPEGDAARMRQYRREVNEIYSNYLVYDNAQDIASKHISYYREPGLIDDIWNVDVIGISTKPEAVAKAEMLNEKLELLKQAVKHFNIAQREGILMEAYEKLSNNEAYYRDPSNGAFLALYKTISAARSYKDGDGIRHNGGGFAGQVEGYNPNDSNVDIYERLLLPIMNRVRDASNSVTWERDVAGRISGVSGAVFGNLAVPAVLDGRPVTEIGYLAFSGCDDVEEFILPSSVKTISSQAFQKCSSLKRVVIPEGVTEVGSFLFFDCSRLESLTIPTTLKSVPEQMFDGFSGQLKTVYTAKGDANRVKEMLATTGCPLDNVRITDEDPSEDPVDSVGPSVGPDVPDEPSEPEPEVDVVAEADIAAGATISKAATVGGVWLDGSGTPAGSLELKLAKANKKTGLSKVTGSVTLLGGKKVSLKADVKDGYALGDGPQVVTLTGKGVSLTVKVGTDAVGNLVFTGAGEADGSGAVTSAALGGEVANPSGLAAYLDKSFALGVEGEILTYGGADFVPYREPVVVKGTKWSFAKAASIKFAKLKGSKDKTKVLQGYDDPKKPNVSGLKLTYTAKKGTFKGSFKAYALQGAAGKEKLKKYTVNVVGIVVGGKGYGKVTCKKPAVSFPIKVE